jgi:Domain of unknown function (DUF1707)
MDEQTPRPPGSEGWRFSAPGGPARYVGPAAGWRDDRRLRVSDADRDAIITELGEHFQAGRLDAAELEDRTGRALRARVGGDLDELLADLPAAPQQLVGPAPDGRRWPPFPALAVPLLVAAALVTAILVAGGAGWHHQWAAGWALWWVVPVIVLRTLWWRRIRGARPWR